jgi:hypothetical protein
MKIIRFLGIIFIIIVFLQGCKTKYNISDYLPSLPLSNKELVERLDNSRSDIGQIFFRRATIQIESDKNNQSVRSNICLKRDSFIRVSLLAPFGIELARISFEPNRVIIIDRINQDVIYTGFKVVSDKIGFEVDFDMLQSLFLNEAFSFYAKKGFELSDYHNRLRNKQYVLSSFKKKQFNQLDDRDNWEDFIFHELIIDSDHFYLKETSFLNRNESFDANIVYNDFESDATDFYFPGGFSVVVNHFKSSFLVDIDFGSVRFDDENNISFSIPEKYEKVYR